MIGPGCECVATWGIEGCIPVVKTSRSKLRTHFKDCGTLSIYGIHRRDKFPTVENQHIVSKRLTATGKKMGKRSNSGPESIWKRNRNDSKTCRRCSLFFICEMPIENGTRIPFSLMKGAQEEKLEMLWVGDTLEGSVGEYTLEGPVGEYTLEGSVGCKINIAQYLPQGFNPTISYLGTHTVHLHKCKPTIYKVNHSNTVTLKMSLNISRRLLHELWYEEMRPMFNKT